MASKLINYSQSSYKFSFFALDPFGPTGIPLNFVHEIIRRPIIEGYLYKGLFFILTEGSRSVGNTGPVRLFPVFPTDLSTIFLVVSYRNFYLLHEFQQA
jgi:hypothetical protein